MRQERRAPKQSLDALTGLRFVAALGVIIYHYGLGLLDPGALRRVASGGFVGVDLFYVLSGFVLAYVYTPSAPIALRRFLVARIARIYPTYLLGLLLAAPLLIRAIAGKPTLLSQAARGGGTILLHLFMVHAWVGNVGTWNVPDWSVSCEWAFYIAFPWLGPWLFRTRHPLWLALFVWLTGISLAFADHAMHPAYLGVTSESVGFATGLLEYHPIPRLHEFALGILSARIWLEGSWCQRPAWTAWMAPLAAAVPLLVLASAVPVPRLPMSNGLFAPAFALLIITLANGAGWLARALSTRVMVVLGESSYAAYILHWPLWALTSPLRANVSLGALGDFAAYLGTVVVASLLAVRFVEKPLRAKLRARLG